ncbi:hypothetical protein EGT74_23465 [Chitinophaga lutea]|uniref:Tyr recombinase domain-containing protein n=1 Tax=Chitinophaga lutea TaxID=2488634 RepID=A0A3N4PKI6_9BACT|nr:tyrosine-type recombinase/integrase [Chitinophaga lutea]RPE05351.1 hypothetical protein EGT74_23465 [Chitinophaga lutea]
MCLDNGVPLETVSRMLGHTNLRTTQIYARVTRRNISVNMDGLEKILFKGKGEFRVAKLRELYKRYKIAA